VEPCPFSPFSDVNIREMNLRQALKSKFLARLREFPGELRETGGGCVLWQKKEWVASLLGDTQAGKVNYNSEWKRVRVN